MDRNRGLRVALAILAVVAVGLAAAAAAPLFEQGAGSQVPVEQPVDTDRPEESGGEVPLPLEFIIYPIVAIAAITILIQFAADPWEWLKRVLTSVAVIAILLGAVLLVPRFLAVGEPQRPNASAGPPEAGNETTQNGSAIAGEGASDSPLIPTDDLALVVLVAAVLGAVALLAWRVGAIQTALGVGGGSEGPSDDLDTIGEVAGRAADDVESAATPEAADNAIYRAWSEMVDLLDAPDPQSGTPRQFASAAVEAGMDPGEVDVLTRTFEEVRYGGASLSPERRERATEALRRIEAPHGEDDASDTT